MRRKKNLKSKSLPKSDLSIFNVTPPTEEEMKRIIKKLDPCDIVAKYPGGMKQFIHDQIEGGKVVQLYKDNYPIPSLKNLGVQYPELRPILIDGILRRGETMNVIASPKRGKSWLTGNLAMALAAGSKWFDKFKVDRGRILIFDNELHPETIYYRGRLLGDAFGIPPSVWEDMIHVVPLRGKNVDIDGLERWLETIRPGDYALCVLDSFYRFMPKGLNENDNASMTQLYNRIDEYAEKYDLSFVLIHHASKGVQSNKSVTDVGSGAGAQSRAADVHLILRDHEEDGVIVVDLAVRSFEPVDPFCVRFKFPKFELAPSYNPESLKGKEGKGRPSREREEADKIKQEKLLNAISGPITIDGMGRLAETLGFKITSTSLKRMVQVWKEENKLIQQTEAAGNKAATFINPNYKPSEQVVENSENNTDSQPEQLDAQPEEIPDIIEDHEDLDTDTEPPF